MLIYFAGSIRGGRDDAELYARLIGYLQTFGVVLTEHVGSDELLRQETSMREEEIFSRDMQWLQEADLVVAEVTTPSLGVGYEIAVAQALGKKILCLFRPEAHRRLSALIGGNSFLEVRCYAFPEEAEKAIAAWIGKVR